MVALPYEPVKPLVNDMPSCITVQAIGTVPA